MSMIKEHQVRKYIERHQLNIDENDMLTLPLWKLINIINTYAEGAIGRLEDRLFVQIGEGNGHLRYAYNHNTHGFEWQVTDVNGELVDVHESLSDWLE